MEQLDKKMEGIRKMMEEMKVEKYAIVNTELADLDEYVKTLYLKVLCTVIQYENIPSEMQTLFLRRIIRGMNVDDSMEDCMRKALEISDADMKEFLSLMKKNEVKYYFTLDALLMTAMGNATKANYEYLSELIELSDVTKRDLEYICLIAKSVLQQEPSFYDEAKDRVNDHVKNLDFSPYIQNYYAGIIADTSIKKVFSAPDEWCGTYKMAYPNYYEGKEVYFQNLDMEICTEWNFKSCRKVIFKNCKIKGLGGTFCFQKVEKVYFENCNLSDFSNRVAYMKSVNDFSTIDCEYENCGYITDDGSGARGGLFYVDNGWYGTKCKILLQGNTLLNCYIKLKRSLSYTGVSGVFIGFENGDYVKQMTIANNIFKNCQCINNVKFKRAVIGNENLFDVPEIVEENNICLGENIRLFEKPIS